MANETRFADNFDRLLGLHRLTAKRASELLEVTPVSVSRWLNGHREPDGDSLYRISLYFGIDAWAFREMSAVDFVTTWLGDPERFEATEALIATGATVEDMLELLARGGNAATADEEVMAEHLRVQNVRAAQRRPELVAVEDDPVLLMARAIAALTASRPDSAEVLRQAVTEAVPPPAEPTKIDLAKELRESVDAAEKRRVRSKARPTKRS